jgi:hypothetical protein
MFTHIVDHVYIWFIGFYTNMLGQMVSSKFRLVISAVQSMFFTWVGLNWWLETLCGVMPLFWVLEEKERPRDKT